MAYTTLSALKEFGGFQTNNDDDLLEALIGSAKNIIDGHTDRVFDVQDETTRTYSRYRGVPSRFSSNTLYLDVELAEEASVITDSPTVVYLPENDAPYYSIVLVEGSWAYPQVQVTGYFGYSRIAPPAIEQACLRLAKWLYDMRDTNSGDSVVVTPDGQVLLPQGLPADVKTMLAPFRRVRVV